MLKYTAAFIAGVVGALLMAQPATAEVIKVGEDSFVTRDAAVVEATPYEAWQVLIAPSQWWNNSHTWSADAENLYISAQAGGCFCELLAPPKGAPDGIRRGSAHHMTVVLADPPKVLRMRGGLGPLQSEPVDGVLTITLNPSDAGTVIVFEYVVGGYMRFESEQISKAMDGVMSQQLVGLAKLLGPVAAEASPEADVDDTEVEEDPETEAEADKPEKKETQSVEEAFGSLADD
jgi:hypothetical protein